MDVLNCGPSSTVGAMDLRTPCPLALGTHKEGSRKGLKQEVELSGGCVYPCSGWAATALSRRAHSFTCCFPGWWDHVVGKTEPDRVHI